MSVNDKSLVVGLAVIILLMGVLLGFGIGSINPCNGAWGDGFRAGIERAPGGPDELRR